MAIDREKILVAAQKYVEKKKYDKAVIEYQKVIQEDPNDARTLLKIGDLQSKMEDYADAVATYERVGRFYASQGFSLKAIAVYKQIRELISNRVPKLEEKYAHVAPKLAELYQQLGLTSDALAALDEVATRLQRQGREQEAVEVFRKIVELDPSNPLPHLRLAEALLRGKDADGAVAEFAIAAGQLAKLGRRDDALKVIERLLQHKPEPAHARAAAEIYLARNAPNDGLQALAKLQICFQANPRDLDTLDLLARAFNHIGQAAKAIEVQKEMARIARESGKTDLFREIVGRLLKLVPSDQTVHQLAAASDAPPARPSQGPMSSASPSTDASASHRGLPGRDPSYEDIADSDIDDSEEPLELSRRAARPTEDVEASVEVVEEANELSPDALERVAQVLADAASLGRARLPAKAIATLRTGVAAVPQSLELREALCDVLIKSGHAREGAQEMLELAGLQMEQLGAEDAVQTLQDLLAIDPHNAGAVEMLRALGYEIVDEPVEGSSAQAEHAVSAARAAAWEQTDRLAAQPGYESSNGEVPLPSYDLEEVGPDDVVAQPSRSLLNSRAHGQPSVAGGRNGTSGTASHARHSVDEIDDPFGDSPLPSFPLEGASEASVGARPAARAGAELESALEEADFFASRGLYDDARTILDEQLLRLPNHPLLLERLIDLDAEERSAQGGSGTRPSPAAGGVEDRAFDIAESLGALDADDHAPAAGSGAGRVEPTEQQVDVEEVFAKFKEGVAKQIGADDSQSHYDLGVAYKDMELFEDAIRELQTAANDARHACVCNSMIGMIHLERGNINEAIEALLRALESPDRTKEQDAAVSYELAAAYEVRKMNKQALEYFQRAARLIPGFRDVVDRVRRLQKVDPKPPARAVAVGADDEFDRAFDDILGKKRS
ncbi:MAG: tetratricopeptide repeat protein [Myxococcota bacterium]|nr:tetratricopeptide repeat protein [Myxococcota bacterium]